MLIGQLKHETELDDSVPEENVPAGQLETGLIDVQMEAPAEDVVYAGHPKQSTEHVYSVYEKAGQRVHAEEPGFVLKDPGEQSTHVFMVVVYFPAGQALGFRFEVQAVAPAYEGVPAGQLKQMALPVTSE